jgi:hypothetical protein
VKTTIEIPDELFKRAKATAAIRGESLKELIRDALETRLTAVPLPQAGRSGWRSVFGLAEPTSVEAVNRVIAEELEQADPSEWR